MQRTLIQGGNLVLEGGVTVGDILVEEGKIVAIGPELDAADAEVIDARDQFVIPGGIDAHTHMNLDVGIAQATDDFYTGTVAAACGGTTTIIDHMGFGPRGCGLHHQLEVYKEWAKDKAVIDYSFHGVVQHVNDEILDEMESMVNEEGINSFKLYLTYGYRLTDGDAFKAMERLSKLGAITTVHPENHEVIEHLRAKFVSEGKLSPIYHAKSRPAQCEAEAIGRMLQMCDMVPEACLYVVHMSNRQGLYLLNEARARGQNAIVETCPQYLFLDETRYLEPNNEGLKYIMSPPLRTKADNVELWNGIQKGDIDVIATDHCPFDFHGTKQKGKDDFTKCPGGAPGVEARVPLMFSEGVMKGRITVERFVDLVSTNPAKIFGIYPQKGALKVGSDADIVLIDPNKKITLTHSMLHENVDYTPYEGFELQGYPTLTMARGQVIVKDNDFVGQAGTGHFIKRKKRELV